MASLPSYHEATSKPDWLRVAAPHVAFRDYRALCLVDRRSWRIFAPCLWVNVLNAVRRHGLDPADDVAWWFDFLDNRLAQVAPGTRALVRVLDARGFAKHTHHFASDHDGGALADSFRRALRLLPNANCIILDAHPDLDPAFLTGSLPSAPGPRAHRPRLLSLARCPNRLPAHFVASPCLERLIYLDVSHVPGSILPMLDPHVLPCLRILKIQGREVGDAMLEALALRFMRRLWSLDLSDNKVTDAAIEAVSRLMLPCGTLRSRAHFAVEGHVSALSLGTPEYGSFFALQESEWSGSFSHPDRYLADAPAYSPHPCLADAGHEAPLPVRSDGRAPVRKDTAEAATRILSRDETDLAVDDFCQSRGATHVHLSTLHRCSATGIQRLLRTSSGHLQELSCDSLPLLCPSALKPGVWPDGARLYGILGAAHLFRPAFSSNLGTLRVHHSLVTHVPALEVNGISTMAQDFLAETAILERVDRAYPQAYLPDMNPRLTSLTLTGIPRRSSGPLTRRLVHFLSALSVQERAIQDAYAHGPRRGPSLLRGLRYLGLVFEPDHGGVDAPASDDFDAAELMSTGDGGFSFFRDEQQADRRAGAAAPTSRAKGSLHSEAVARAARPTGAAAQDNEEFATYAGEWNGKPFSLPVWIGPKSSSNPVLGEYRRLVVEAGLAGAPGPATPAQLLAGAPEGSYVFQTAWCAAVMPRELLPPPRHVVAGMSDVLDELRAFRRAARAKYARAQEAARGDASLAPLGAPPHLHWTGTLEVFTSTASTLAGAAHWS